MQFSWMQGTSEHLNSITIPVLFIESLDLDYIAAALLSYLVEQQIARENPEWWHVSDIELQNRLLISEGQLRRCRRALEKFVATTRRGMPAKMFYRVNLEAIAQSLGIEETMV